MFLFKYALFFSGNKNLDQRLGAKLNKHVFSKFCLNFFSFSSFFSFLVWKTLKSRFRLSSRVCSTQTLVKIYKIDSLKNLYYLLESMIFIVGQTKKRIFSWNVSWNQLRMRRAKIFLKFFWRKLKIIVSQGELSTEQIFPKSPNIQNFKIFKDGLIMNSKAIIIILFHKSIFQINFIPKIFHCCVRHYF